jgi:uncharacterized protein (TIGR02118 family)
MSTNRRDLVKGAGAAVTLGMLASTFSAVLPRGARAADSAKGANCLTVIYPAGADVKFDADYYRDHHLKTIMTLYGKTISRFELRKAAPAAAGAPPAAYSAAVNIWIADMDAFGKKNQEHGPTLVKDVPNFTNGQPTIQFDKIEGMMGSPAAAMKLGDSCLTILYPNGENVRWDVDYYRTHHMPLIMSLYKKEAIKRFELRKGDTGQAPGSKPAYIGSVNIYINDQKAFEEAGKKNGQALRDDVPHFSSAQPTVIPTVIYGVA